MPHRPSCRIFVCLVSLWITALPSAGYAQKKKGSALKAPEPGYAFPPGGNPGTTVEVSLGGYDWTPDVELIPLSPNVKLEFTGELGPVIVPPPPYWFGPKGTIAPIPLPRERAAKLTLPAGLPPGPIRWTTASANGIGANTGTLWVGDGRPEVLEDSRLQKSQILPTLPVTVNGRLSRIEEVDRYTFTPTRSGPVTVEAFARRLGIDCNLAITIRDPSGKTVADVVDTAGQDLALTFSAQANTAYQLELHDLDFRGDRSFVYRLALTPGPRVAGCIPAVGQRGTSQAVEFVGYGIATGAAKLESTTQIVHFPADPKVQSHSYRLETTHGQTPIFDIPIVDTPETAANVASVSPVSLPIHATGILDKLSEARWRFPGKKGEQIRLDVQARSLGSPLDVSVVVLDVSGKELARNDDLPNTTDAGLTLSLPADGTYTAVVTDVSGNTGTRAALYRIVAKILTADFTLTVTPRVNLEFGGTANLPVTVNRTGGFKGAITLSVAGLPPGVTLPAKLEIPANAATCNLTFTVSDTADVSCWPITITGVAKIGDNAETRTASATYSADMTFRDPTRPITDQVRLCTTLSPRISLVCVEADGGRKVHRGSTHPAEVTIERHDGFAGPVSLQMSAKQSYQRQGITGPDMTVPADTTRAFYPCFMPEWLETTRTSRMELIGVIRVKDPKGRERFLATPMAGRITMSIEGEILKVSTPVVDATFSPDHTLTIPVSVHRSAKLPVPVRLELVVSKELADVVTSEPVTLPLGHTECPFVVRMVRALPPGRHTLRVRATALQDGQYAVVSEVGITVDGSGSRPGSSTQVR